jgi:hypothetical protein
MLVVYLGGSSKFSKRSLKSAAEAAHTTEDVTWSDQLADEVHKSVRHQFPKRRVFVRGVDEIWAADLVDMQHYMINSTMDPSIY